MKSAFVFPIYLATNKIQKQIQKEDITEDRGTWYQEKYAESMNNYHMSYITVTYIHIGIPGT